MTKAEHFSPVYTERNDRVYNAALTLTAIFIAFAVIATLICGTVPAIGEIMSDAASTSANSYTVLSVSELFADSFSSSISELTVIAVIFIISFSLFFDSLARLICAIRGFTFGSLLYYVLSIAFGNYVVLLQFVAMVINSAIIITCCSLCSIVNKNLMRAHHTKNRRTFFRACVTDLLILCVSCGAICTVNILKLLLT